MSRSATIIAPLAMLFVAIAACNGGTEAAIDIDQTMDTPDLNETIAVDVRSPDIEGPDGILDGEVGGDVGADAPDDSPEAIPWDASAPGPDPQTLLGLFGVVEERFPGDYERHLTDSLYLSGWFAQAPRASRLVPVAQAGACTRWAYQCTMAEPWTCAYGKYCSRDQCVQDSPGASVGTLTVDGLKSVPHVELPVPWDGVYAADSLPAGSQDGFDASTMVTLRATGGDLPAFEVQSPGVESLAAPDLLAGVSVVLEDTDTTFHWVPAAADATGRIRLVIKADNQCHGCPETARISCEGPDSGELVVPGELLAGLPYIVSNPNATAGTDRPRSYLERYRFGVVQLSDGSVELMVSSRVSFHVDHALP